MSQQEVKQNTNIYLINQQRRKEVTREQTKKTNLKRNKGQVVNTQQLGKFKTIAISYYEFMDKDTN